MALAKQSRPSDSILELIKKVVEPDEVVEPSRHRCSSMVNREYGVERVPHGLFACGPL